jgi:hypothetical protein
VVVVVVVVVVVEVAMVVCDPLICRLSLTPSLAQSSALSPAMVLSLSRCRSCSLPLTPPLTL